MRPSMIQEFHNNRITSIRMYKLYTDSPIPLPLNHMLLMYRLATEVLLNILVKTASIAKGRNHTRREAPGRNHKDFIQGATE